MSILCITNDFGPRAGGIETFVIGLIERFPKNSIIVFTSNQENCAEYDQRWLDTYGVEVIRDRSTILLPTPRVARVINRIVKDRGITQAWFGAAAPLGLLAGGLRKNGVSRIVALTHGHEVWWAKIPPFNAAMRYIGKEVDHVTYLGDFTRRQISRALSPTAQSAMVKVAPGIDTDHFSPLGSTEVRNRLGLVNKKVIVSVGRLVQRKGHDVLLKALPAIRAAIPEVHVVIVGKGSYEKKLRQILQRNGCSELVTFVGSVGYQELPQYLRAGNVFVMPCRSRFFGLEIEALGIVFLEASACGLPVVAGDSGGAPDAVKESLTGFVVNGKSSAAVAAATIEILSDDTLALSMGRAGRRWIEEKWRWQIWSTKFNALFK